MTSDIDSAGSPLEPERSTQYEVGVKGEFLDGKLTATLAAYEITKTNVSTSVLGTDRSIAALEKSKVEALNWI